MIIVFINQAFQKGHTNPKVPTMSMLDLDTVKGSIILIT